MTTTMTETNDCALLWYGHAEGQGWTRSCRGRTRSCLVPGTIDFEAPTGTTDWDPVQWRGTTGNDRCGISNFRGTTEKVGRAARERTCGTKGHELKIE